MIKEIITAIFISTTPNKDLKCMSEALYFEARGEGRVGLVAVGNVIKNRVKSDKFPNSVCGVVNQYKQFSYTLKDSLDIKNKEVYDRIKNLSHLILNNEIISPVGDSLYFHADYYKGHKFKPYWAKEKIEVAKINNHIFYKESFNE